MQPPLVQVQGEERASRARDETPLHLLRAVPARGTDSAGTCQLQLQPKLLPTILKPYAHLRSPS